MKVRLTIVILGVVLGFAAKWVVGVVKAPSDRSAATQSDAK